MNNIINKLTKNKAYLTTLIVLVSILALFTIYSIYAISLLVGIANLARLVIVIFLALFFCLFTLFGIKMVIKGNKTMMISYSAILIVYLLILGLVSFQVHRTYGRIRGITANYIHYSTSIVTRADHKATELSEMTDGNIGILDNGGSVNTQLTQEIVEENKFENEVIEYDSYVNIIFALLNQEIDYAFLPTNYPIMFSESEEFKTLSDDTKIIYTKDKRIESKRRRASNKINEPFTMLLMGIDSTQEDISKGSLNGDALMVVTFNPNTLEATMLSIPRDTYVPITCFNDRHNKITHSAWFGEECVIETIEEFIDIEIDYYVKMNFTGIVNLVDALGGIEVDVPYSFCEQDSKRRWGSNIVYVKEGIQTLDGEQALALTRNRKNNSRICGSEWGGYTSNDFIRGQNQQIVLKGIIDSSKEIRSLDTINNLIDVIGSSLETNMSTQEIFSFYDIFREMVAVSERLPFAEPFTIRRLQLSGYDQYIVDYSYVHRAGTRLNLYNFVPYDESLEIVKREMRINLGQEKRIPNYYFTYNFQEPFKETVLGRIPSGTRSVQLMPNFVSRNINELNTFANQNGIRVIVNNITSTNQNDFVGMIRSQNILANIDTRYTGGEIRVDVVSKIERNGPSTPTTTNCSDEGFRSDSNCLLRDLSGMTKNQVSTYFTSRGVTVKINYNTITMSMEEYNKEKSGTITSQSKNVNTRLFDLHNGEITLTFMEEFKEEEPDEEIIEDEE